MCTAGRRRKWGKKVLVSVRPWPCVGGEWLRREHQAVRGKKGVDTALRVPRGREADLGDSPRGIGGGCFTEVAFGLTLGERVHSGQVEGEGEEGTKWAG